MYLETKRLIIKSHTPDNAELMCMWENDPELLYYSDNQPENREPASISGTEEYLKKIMQDDDNPVSIHFAVHKNNDNEFIGYGMIAEIDAYNKHCKLGIVIGNKQEWGKGFGKETLHNIANYCFSVLAMNRIGAEIYDFNSKAIRVFEKTGFKREGVLRETVLKNGKYADEYIYSLLRNEWENNLKK